MDRRRGRGIAASAVEDTISCGVFDIVSPYLATGGAIKNTAMSIDGIRDGASNTLMLSENTRAGDSWTAGYNLDLGNLWKSDVPYDGKTDTFYKCEAALGFRIPESKTSPEGLEFPMNVNVDGRPSGEPRGASPGSYHSGLVIVTFCDGHVRPLDQGIDPNTYLHLITPNGKKAGEWAQGLGLAYLGDTQRLLRRAGRGTSRQQPWFNVGRTTNPSAPPAPGGFRFLAAAFFGVRRFIAAFFRRTRETALSLFGRASAPSVDDGPREKAAINRRTPKGSPGEATGGG